MEIKLALQNRGKLRQTAYLVLTFFALLAVLDVLARWRL